MLPDAVADRRDPFASLLGASRRSWRPAEPPPAAFHGPFLQAEADWHAALLGPAKLTAERSLLLAGAPGSFLTGVAVALLSQRLAAGRPCLILSTDATPRQLTDQVTRQLLFDGSDAGSALRHLEVVRSSARDADVLADADADLVLVENVSMLAALSSAQPSPSAAEREVDALNDLLAAASPAALIACATRRQQLTRLATACTYAALVGRNQSGLRYVMTKNRFGPVPAPVELRVHNRALTLARPPA